MINSLTTTNLQEFNILANMANTLCKSEALPACYKNAANVLAALQTGLEMGLKPMQSLNSLYIVNGKITIWGSAQVQLLKSHGWKIIVNSHNDKVCDLSIIRDDETFSYKTTFEELPSTSKAKAFAPKEKLYYHTISRLIRFYCPEVLGGQHLYNEIEAEAITYNTTSKIVKTEPKDELLEFITKEVSTLEALQSVKDQLTTDEQKTAYNERLTELTPKVVIAEAVVVEQENELETLAKARYQGEEYQQYIQMISDSHSVESLSELPPEVQAEQIKILKQIK
jgi:hypothetical protein